MASSTPTSHEITVPRRLQGGAVQRCALLYAIRGRLLPVLTEAISRLRLAQCEVDTPRDMRDALYDRDITLVVVHFGRDVLSGIATCQTIRKHPDGEKLPVLAVLDASVIDEYPLDSGADDVLILPCDAAEAALRLQLLLWRRDDAGAPAVVKIGDLTIDCEAMHVRYQGVPVSLTYKEFALLQYLVGTSGAAVRRDQILAAVWGGDYFGGDRTVDIHVRRLRAKIPCLADRIETVHGVGYRFNASEPV